MVDQAMHHYIGRLWHHRGGRADSDGGEGSGVPGGCCIENVDTLLLPFGFRRVRRSCFTILQDPLLRGANLNVYSFDLCTAQKALRVGEDIGKRCLRDHQIELSVFRVNDGAIPDGFREFEDSEQIRDACLATTTAAALRAGPDAIASACAAT